MRTLKFFIGILLAPLCYVAIRTWIDLVLELRPDRVSQVPPTTWGLLGGFLLWLVIFYSLPRPIRSYVLAHELTHALWGAFMGARVYNINVTGKGGSVQLSKTNFLIVLAPYFFPLYTILVIIGYTILCAFFDMRPYGPIWLSLVGLTWGFHLTFTTTTLMSHQSDIQEGGRLFSYTIIILFNIMGLCLWIVAIAPPTIELLETTFLGHLHAVCDRIGGGISRHWER